MIKRHSFAAIALAVALVGGLAAPAFAHGNHDGYRNSDRHHHYDDGHDNSGDIEIVADNLNNPRQIAVNDGAVYVAEAGTGGTYCPTGNPVDGCAGLTGSVTRLKHGYASRVQTGLFSITAGEGEVVGVDALAFKGDKLYGISTGTCDVPPGAPAELVAQLGQVLRLRGGTDFTAVGSASSLECTTNPDGQEVDTDPYGLAIRGKSFYVADAAGNDIVKIRKGVTSLVKVLSTTGQPVPTSLAWGPDGALYIGTLNFEAGPGGAAVYRLDVDSGDLSVYASGLTAVTSLAFGRHGRLYVTEWTTGFGPTGPAPDGDVVSIPWGGGLVGRKTIGTGSLHFPTGVGYLDGAIYVSNWGIAPGVDGAFGPGNHGQLVKITL